jgi:uncharacterized protein (TIGR02466 family)
VYKLTELAVANLNKAARAEIVEMSDFSKTRYNSIFATPLVTHIWDDAPELNALLREHILAHETESRGVAKSNHGGWHSETGQLEFCGDAGRRLLSHMFALADEATRRVAAEQRKESSPCQWTLSAWVNVNRSGAFNKVHVHPASTWSGTYYVDAGAPLEPDGGAPIHLFDPCTGRSTTFLPGVVPASIYINPKPGLMVLFPSYVPHMVFPHSGTGTRISIAFNLRNEPFP